MKKAYINFFDKNKDFSNFKNVIFMKFNDSVDSLKKALEKLEQEINYPPNSLSGPSLDATIDILSSNFYLKKDFDEITLVNEKLPNLNTNEMNKYVNILNTAVYACTEDYYYKYNKWSKDKLFKQNFLLRVFFPEESKDQILSFIREDVLSW